MYHVSFSFASVVRNSNQTKQEPLLPMTVCRCSACVLEHKEHNHSPPTTGPLKSPIMHACMHACIHCYCCSMDIGPEDRGRFLSGKKCLSNEWTVRAVKQTMRKSMRSTRKINGFSKDVKESASITFRDRPCRERESAGWRSTTSYHPTIVPSGYSVIRTRTRRHAPAVLPLKM
jgi:hypothetical protein